MLVLIWDAKNHVQLGMSDGPLLEQPFQPFQVITNHMVFLHVLNESAFCWLGIFMILKYSLSQSFSPFEKIRLP